MRFSYAGTTTYLGPESTNLGCLILCRHRLHAGLLRELTALELLIVRDLWLIRYELNPYVTQMCLVGMRFSSFSRRS